MRIAGSIITAICGIAVTVSVFSLDWFDGGISAWDWIDAAIDASAAAGDYIYMVLVLIGGILMAACAIPAFIVSLASKGGRVAIVILGIFAIVGAVMAIGGSAWFLIDTVTTDGFQFDWLGYGVWIAIGAAILGFIFAIITAAFSRGKQDW